VSRLRELWSRHRPTTRRGKAALLLAGVGLAAVAAVGLFVVLPWAYGMYGYHPEESARSWSALTPQYAESPTCQRCHAEEYEPWSEAEHAVVTCGSCHGPLAEHAATATAVGPLPPGAAVPPAHEDLCVLCHEQAPGRPEGFPAVDLVKHYNGAPCLGCHEPHRVEARVPPFISHPIDDLPVCTTCHAPAGLKPVPVGHEEVPDAVCRSCHPMPPTSRSNP
jgi:hypothetical protein